MNHPLLESVHLDTTPATFRAVVRLIGQPSALNGPTRKGVIVGEVRPCGLGRRLRQRHAWPGLDGEFHLRVAGEPPGPDDDSREDEHDVPGNAFGHGRSPRQHHTQKVCAL